MARLEPGSNFFSLTKEIERLKYQLLQYKTLLGVAPFDKIALKGDKGDIGPRGLRGEQGVPGPKGDKGDKGDTGAKGDTGNTGAQGIKGEKGEKGEKGNTGATGAKGATGPRGLQGIQGEKGEKGEQGIQGIQGIQGLRGYKGDTGKYGETKFVINDNMELEQHTLIGDQLNFSLVDGDLVLTEEGETVNLGTVVYKNPNVIDMRAGEYLMDIISAINALPEAEKPTVENPLTINFYNHSKTIDWTRWSELIHVPRFVAINFVGNIEWWSVNYYPQMAYDEGLLNGNPLDKLFLGFSFDRTNDDSLTFLSGLPLNLSMIYFGGIDDMAEEVADYSELDVNFHGNGLLGLVRVSGSKEDDIRNNALYKKVNGVFVDITPNFSYCNLTGANNSFAYLYYSNNQGANFQNANNQGAYFDFANNHGANFSFANNVNASFYYANNQSMYFYFANNQNANFGYTNNQNANFSYANLKQANWYNVVSIVNANFQNADLTGGVNLPERINTKAKWIAECGAGNVNAETIWIDGTSILS